MRATGDVIEFVQKYYNMDFPKPFRSWPIHAVLPSKAAMPEQKTKMNYSINKEAALSFSGHFIKRVLPHMTT
jgi:hypothetical protein